jgi:hypothetical protein
VYVRALCTSRHPNGPIRCLHLGEFAFGAVSGVVVGVSAAARGWLRRRGSASPTAGEHPPRSGRRGRRGTRHRGPGAHRIDGSCPAARWRPDGPGRQRRRPSSPRRSPRRRRAGWPDVFGMVGARTRPRRRTHHALPNDEGPVGTGPSVCSMRMRGLEPPRDCSHGDLNAARLPIPPHPPACSEHSDRLNLCVRSSPPPVLLPSSPPAAIVQGTRTPPSHGGNRGSNPRGGTTGALAQQGLSVVLGRCAPAMRQLRRRDRSALDPSVHRRGFCPRCLRRPMGGAAGPGGHN